MSNRSNTSNTDILPPSRDARYQRAEEALPTITPLVTHRWLTTGAAMVALLALGAGFFWKLIVLHRVLIPIDLLYATNPAFHFYSDVLWQPLSSRITTPTNSLDADNVLQFYPWAALAAHELHQHVLPLWNPYAFAGTPFLASMQPAVLYPLNLLLEWVLPAPAIPGWRAAIDLVLALVGVFLLARHLALSRQAAFLTAVSFGLSLPFVVWIEHPIDVASAWLPWILLCVAQTIATRGRLPWLLATAAVLALEILAGHPESTAHIILLSSAYALFLVILAWRRGQRVMPLLQALGALVAALIFGCAIASAHLIPAVAQVPLTEDAATRSLATHVPVWGEPGQWPTLAMAVIPNFFGNPTWNVSLLPVANYSETALYVGVVPLLLASIALWRRREAHTYFFGIVAVITLGIAARLPVIALFNDLPVMHILDNGRLRIEFALAMAILAGYGLDVLRHEGVSRVVWLLARFWLFVVVLLGIVGTVFLFAYPDLFAFLRAHAGALAVLNHLYPGLQRWLSQPHAQQTLSLPAALRVALPSVWLMLFVAVLWLYRHGKSSTNRLIWVALVATVADLFVTGVDYHATASYADAVQTPPAVRIVQRDQSIYRVAGLGAALLPSLSSLYGLQDIRGYDPAYDATYGQFFTANFASTPGIMLRLDATKPDPVARRAFDLMNVKYIFTSCHLSLGHPYRLVYRGQGCVYLNPTVMPRAVLLHSVRWATTKQAITLMRDGAFDARTTALLDPTSVNRREWPRNSQPSSDGSGVAQITRYDPDDVELTVRSKQSGLLLLTDAYAAGWRAYVDGREVPVARADAVFRAVPVGRGSHHVRFSYVPRPFILGVITSIAALAAWVILALYALVRLRRHRSLRNRPS